MGCWCEAECTPGQGGELEGGTVQFPWWVKVGGRGARGVGVEPFQTIGCVERRRRQHGRAEGGEGGLDRLWRTAFEPGEEIEIGRGEAVPEFFDLGDIDFAPVFWAEVGEGLPREAGGDADAQAASDKFQK